MKGRRSVGVAAAVAVCSLVLLYGRVLARLAQDWLNDSDYSHGMLVAPLAAYFAWTRREEILACPTRPSVVGLIGVIAGLGLLYAGLLGAELFLTRVSLLCVVAGSVLFLSGWQMLRLLAFPIGLLLLMIPLPSIIFNQIAFPLQLLASRVGEVVLETAGVPVLREGNIIRLAHTTLEVAEACSGIRSLVSLLTMGIVYGYLIDPRGGIRTLIALSTIPVAVLTNGARVAGTGLAAHYYGAGAADGFFHTFSGWLIFGTAFLALLVVAHILIRLAPRRDSHDPRPSAVEVKAGV